MTDLPLCGHGALIVLWIGAAIATVIFAMMVYSIVTFCKSPATATQKFAHRAHVEVIWAIIPILILVVTAAPAVKPLIAVEQGCSVVSLAGTR